MPENTGNSEIKRNPDGTFPKGVSGNPAGRPKGSVSIMDEIRRRLKDDPKLIEELAEFYIRNLKMRDLLLRMLDGQPKQSVDVGVDDELTQIEVKIVKNEDTGDKRLREEPSGTPKQD